MKALLEKIRKILRSRRTRQLLTRAVSGVAAIVVFITTYALVLPAITMEQDAFCGIPEHQHTDACYEERLVCEIPEGEEHHHDASCYEKFLICGKEVHIHSTECYQKESNAVVSAGSETAASTDFGAFAEPDLYGSDGSEYEAGTAVTDSAVGGESVMEEAAEEAVSLQAVTEGSGEGNSGPESSDPEGTDEGTAVPEDDTENSLEAVPDGSGSDRNGNVPEDVEDAEQGNSEDTDNYEMTADSSQNTVDEDLGGSGKGSSENINADTANPEDAESQTPEADKDAAIEEGNNSGSEQVNSETEGRDPELGNLLDENDGSGPASETSETSDSAADTSDGDWEANDSTTDTAAAETENADVAATAANAEEAANNATTNVLPEHVETENLSSGFVPELAGIEFGSVLNKHTDFFYFHPEEGQEIPASSAEVTEWKKVKNGLFGSTKLESTDLVKMYLSFTIPAGALNETNQVARYRLPSNIHLTDDQIIAINSTENGMSALYADAAHTMAEADEDTMDDPDEKTRDEGSEMEPGTEDDNAGAEEAGTASGTGEEDGAEEAKAAADTLEYAQDENAANYQKYLGAEAIEGTRTPDEKLKEGAQEYISAIVKAENVFDDEGLYGEKGAFLGQDLIFIFTPYSIEKNQTTYNADGDPVSAGEKITGWFACDFNMSQIDWVEKDTDLDNSTVEKTAEFIFVEKDSEKNVKEISRKLKLVDVTGDQSDAANGGETVAVAETAATEIAAAAETASETASTNETAIATTGNTSEQAASEDTGKGTFKSGTLTADGDGYKITLDYTEEAKIPENAELSVREITAETDKEAYEACLEQAGQQVAADDKTSVDQKASRFFDIEILVKDTDSNGEEETRKIEPSAPVGVNIHIIDDHTITDSASTDEKTSQGDPAVLHFAEQGVEQIDSTVKNSQEKEADKDKSAGKESEPVTEISFEAESFSIYGVVYTVDFHWEVDGNEYEFTLPGGGYVSLEKLVEVLGVANSNVERNAAEKEAESAGLLTLNDIETSEETLSFAENVEKVEFSNPNLLWVGKVEKITTVGALKEANGLEIQYSEGITEELIQKFDAQTVKAGDWALISMQPFTSEESLTVTMKTGEVFTIRVTDAQIKKDFITASGETYTITVTYGRYAGIPEGSELEVREILPGTEEYDQCVSAAQAEFSEDQEIVGGRFFDIVITYQGRKIEPQVPVNVKIDYAQPFELALYDEVNVVHFADKGTEVISDAVLSDDQTSVSFTQGSFSVTGTIITGNWPTGENQYMVLVKYPDPEGSDNYYIVNNDATLTKVNYNSNNNTVDVTDPMLWTSTGSNPSRHLYFNSEASGINATTNVAEGYYRRYLDPSVPEGYTEEWGNDANGGEGNVTLDDGHGLKSGGRVINRDNVLTQTNLDYHNGHIFTNPWNSNRHFGVELDDEGTPVRLIGQQSDENGVEFVFAQAHVVDSVSAYTHSVNHIDIAISGKSDVTVPLAYGTYYYKDSDGDWQEYVVEEDTSIRLEKDNVRITPDDMKHCTIKAYDKNGNELNNAFVVTGYSSNAAALHSDIQVRIEGQFLVANPPQGNVPYYDDANSQTWKDRRNDNRITYSVSAIKTLDYDFIETIDGEQRQLYEKQADGTYKAMTLKVDVAMAASFDYWDERNDCPALDNQTMGWDVRGQWRNGGIPLTGYDWLSGMDFVLGGDADDAESKIVALEITKMVVDEDGHVIKLKKGYPQSFDIYGTNQDSSANVIGVDVGTYNGDYEHNDWYSKIHSKDVLVGESGIGLVFDYDITPGMYYIGEDTDDIPELIADQNDKKWMYTGTRLETEYVWRNDMYSGRHVSKTYTDKDTENYRSIPEIVGNYTGLYNSSTTEEPRENYNSANWRWYNTEENKWETGTYRNGFLEYYVYNTYKPLEEISTTKKWENKEKEEIGWVADVTFKLRKKTVNGDTVTYTNVTKPKAYGEDESWSDTITVNSQNKEAKWENLDPLAEGESYVIIEHAVTGVNEADIVRDQTSGAIKSFMYDGKLYVVSTEDTLTDGNLTYNTEYDNTDIEVQKVWAGNADPGTATMVLYRLVGEKSSDSRKIQITIQADPVPVTTNAGFITVNYTGTNADSSEENGSFTLSNIQGWSRTLEFDRGGVYNFTYTPDGTKVKTVDPESSTGISETTTVNLTATAAETQMFTYTFSVPQNLRPTKGSIDVTCNGDTKTADSSNNWAVSFEVAEDTPVNYSAVGDGNFITEVEVDPASDGSGAHDYVNVSLNPTSAELTRNVNINLDWGQYTPDSGTNVTVTFTPDKQGVESQTVQLNGSPWSASTVLPRLDDSGNLISWSVSSTAESSANNASVSLLNPSNGILGEDSATVDIVGSVAGGMTVRFRMTDGYNTGNIEIRNYKQNDQYNKVGETNYATATIPSIVNGLEPNNDGQGYIFRMPQVYKNGTGNQYRITIRTNAQNAGYINNYGDCVYFYGQPGEVIFDITVNGLYDGSGSAVVVQSGQNLSRSSGITPVYEANTYSTTKAPRLARASKVANGPVKVGSTSSTFYDAAVGGSGDSPFTAILFKDLPEGAEIVSDLPNNKQNQAQQNPVTVNGNGTYKWDNLPTVDEDGKPIYYYVVEKDASARADEMTVTYEYEYNDDGTIKKVTITNTATLNPGDIVVSKSFSGVNSLPEDFKITNDYNDQVFTVSNATGTNPYTWTIEDVPDGTTVTFTESGATINGYTLTVSSGGTVISDSTVSAASVSGQTVTAEFVNTYVQKKTSITLKKVDKSNVNKETLEASDLLDGAKFVLEKYTQLTPVEAKDVEWNNSHNTLNAGDHGVFTFTDLPIGFYKIVEKEYPDGYVSVSGNPVFKVKEDEQTGGLIIEMVDNLDGLVRQDGNSLTIIVGNEPGAALPSTGGPGTGITYLLGITLLGLAGVCLVMKMRRKTT